MYTFFLQSKQQQNKKSYPVRCRSAVAAAVVCLTHTEGIVVEEAAVQHQLHLAWEGASQSPQMKAVLPAASVASLPPDCREEVVT